MTNLQISNDCTCLVQYVHLSCPYCFLTCNNCEFNPLAWSSLMNSTYLSNSLNKTRAIPYVFSPL